MNVKDFAYKPNLKIFLISPVRNITPEEEKQIADYVEAKEIMGFAVYWPKRDTQQADPTGVDICLDNLCAIIIADEVHVWWNPASQGSAFDLGMAFASKRKLVSANSIPWTESGKSFEAVIGNWPFGHKIDQSVYNRKESKC